jgi:hypothetical protein
MARQLSHVSGDSQKTNLAAGHNIGLQQLSNALGAIPRRAPVPVSGDKMRVRGRRDSVVGRCHKTGTDTNTKFMNADNEAKQVQIKNNSKYPSGGLNVRGKSSNAKKPCHIKEPGQRCNKKSQQFEQVKTTFFKDCIPSPGTGRVPSWPFWRMGTLPESWYPILPCDKIENR